MIEPSSTSEGSSESEASTPSEWWVSTPQEPSGLPAGSKQQQRKMELMKEKPRIDLRSGIPIHSSGGEKHISYDQAMNFLWETGTSGVPE
jgi:hypothetical protein